jgi:plastocyanin
MKILHYYTSVFYLLVLIPVLTFISCTKVKDVPEPSFDIVPDKTTVQAGEAITFNFTGTADLITFYSGERTREYRHRERSKVQGTPQLQFLSNRRYGSPTLAIDTTLMVFVSTDFNGTPNAANVNRATWTNISDRAALSRNLGGGTAQTASGIIDLSDFHTSDVPIYIAFKFHDFQSTLSQRTWNIQQVLVDNKLEDGSLVSVGNMNTLSWTAVNMAGTQAWSANTTRLEIAGGAGNTPENIDWLITQPLYLDRVQRDFGLNAKGNPVTKQTNYEYTFAVPGTYTVTFEAINANRWDKKIKIKEFTITVQ